MHELSLAQSILSIADKVLPPDETGLVTAVVVQVGALSGVEPEALLFAFDAIKGEGRLARARLVLEHIPGEAICRNCNSRFALADFTAPCPACGSYNRSIVQGKEFRVLRLEVE
ncbi:MAG: hydrogenase maturation nickel metallochaperone HypA [Lacibacter sp.]